MECLYVVLTLFNLKGQIYAPHFLISKKSLSKEIMWEYSLFKAMVFPAVMYGCESWTIKKAERQRIDAFELWHCRRLLRAPWTARRSDQLILKEINPEYSLGKDWWWSWSSNTLATWWEELTLWKRPWCWERLKTGGEGDDIGWDGWIASLTQWTWVWANSWRWWENRAAWCAAVQGVAKSWTWLSNWTTIIV